MPEICSAWLPRPQWQRQDLQKIDFHVHQIKDLSKGEKSRRGRTKPLKKVLEGALRLKTAESEI